MVYAIILRMWHSLPFDNMVSLVPDSAEDIKLELLASSLALAAKVGCQHLFLRQRQVVGRVSSAERGWMENSTHSVGYVSISPSPSELAVPNVVFVASSAQQDAQADIKDIITSKLDFDTHLLLREALLPLFSAAGLKVPSQLKIKCHNSSEINMEYNFSLSEGNVVVVDRSVSGSTLRPSGQSHKPESVLLVHQLCVSGSLKYLVKDKSPQLQSTSYLVTTKPMVDLNATRQHSNITSKFSVRLDSLIANVTFPLMMICRHSSESFRHWITYQRPIHNQLDKHSAAASTAMEELEESDQQCATASAAWTTSQQLVELFLSLEKDKNPPLTVESSRGSEPSRIIGSNTPIEKHKLTEYSHSPKYPRAHRVVAQEGGQLSSGQSYTSLTSGDREHDYPHDHVAIKIEPTPSVSIKYHPSHNHEAADDTTDSPQVLSSDNDTASSWGASYSVPSRFASNHNKRSKLETTDHVQSRLETPNIREGLSVAEDKLQFSVFGLVKISTIQVRSQLETLLTILEIQGVTGAVDCRKITQGKSSTGQHKATPGKPSKTLLVYKGKGAMV